MDVHKKKQRFFFDPRMDRRVSPPRRGDKFIPRDLDQGRPRSPGKWDDRRDVGGTERSPSPKSKRRSPGNRRRSRGRRRSSSSSSGSSSRSRSHSRSRSASRRRTRRQNRGYSKSSSPEMLREKHDVIDVENYNKGGGPNWRQGNNMRSYSREPMPPHPGLMQMPPRGPPMGYPNRPNQFQAPTYPPPHPPPGNYAGGYQGGGQGYSEEYQGYQGYDNNGQQYYQQPPPTSFNQPPPPTQNSSSPPPFKSAAISSFFQDFNMGQSNWDNAQQTSSNNLIYPGNYSQDNFEAKPRTTAPTNKPEPDELGQQKKTLIKQREEYLKKNSSLLRELSRLKEQRRELLHDNMGESDRILKENTKLQNEISQRLKAIENVVEMLTGIIGDADVMKDLKKEYSRPITPPPGTRSPPKEARTSEGGERDDHLNTGNSSPTRHHSPQTYPTESGHSGSSYQAQSNSNIIYYDPELHWCSYCNIFPKTAAEYLNHLHTPEHKAQIVSLKLDENPWQADEPPEASPPQYGPGPSKRIPIRGVQFLVPSTAWYCRLCKSWLGDIQSATQHLKGVKHTSNFSDFITQHPHWEVDWLSDRTKSYERSSDHISRLREPQKEVNQDSLESEKAKISALSNTLLAVLAQQNKSRSSKRSSSSSSLSSSDMSPKKSKKSKKKKSKKKKKKDISPRSSPPKNIPQGHRRDDLITKWMSSDEKDDIAISLKDRIKQKNDNIRKGPQENISDDERPQDRGDGMKERFGPREFQRDFQREGQRGRDMRDNQRERGPPHFREGAFDSRRRDFRGQRDMRFQRPDHRNDRESPKERRREERDRFDDKKRGPDKPLERPKEQSPKPDKNKETRNKIDKPQGKLWFPSNRSEEEETTFEKQSSESAARKKAEGKKPAQINTPKSKLPFIGRMPILKKKPNEQKVEETSKEPEKSDEKEKMFTWPDIPSLSEEKGGGQESSESAEKKPLPKSTLIISKRPRLGEIEDSKEVAKPALITADTKKKIKTEDIFDEQDMEIDCDAQESVIWEATEAENNTNDKEELHKDFKDALDLLFPEEGKKKESSEKEQKTEASEETSPPGQVVTSQMPPGVNWMAGNAATPYSYPPGAYPNPSQYYAQAYDSNYAAYYAGAQRFPGPPPGIATPTSIPPPSVPPPQVVTAPESLSAEEEGGEGLDEETTQKRKNPPSQRMRRHLQKKRAEAMADSTSTEEPKEESPPPASAPVKKKYEGMDSADLAMLGIDEDDSIAQQF